MTDSASNSDKPLDKMTVKDLREIAKEIPEVTGISSMKKDELLELIQKHQGSVPEEQQEARKEAASEDKAPEAVKAKKVEKTPEAPQEAAEEKISEDKAPVEVKAKEEKKAPAEKKAAPAKAKKTAKKAGQKLATVKDFKEALAQLKAEKEDIRKTGSKKEISILRRRINRLRKRSRKAKEATA